MTFSVTRLLPAIAVAAAAAVIASACSPASPAAPSAPTSSPSAAGSASAPAATTPSVAPPVTGSPSTSAASASAGGTLTVYSGRSEELVGPLVERFEEASGVRVEVRYADTAELASTILEEGGRSPADVFFAQDAGALGAVAAADLFEPLPADVLGRVEDRFRSPEDTWVGVSGRARVAAYNTKRVKETELPASILDFTDAKWKGRLGWAPTNGSFQAFVTALRKLQGEDVARRWLEGIKANEPKVYEGNSPALEAVAAGEVDVAFINHYYLLRQLEEQGAGYPAANHFFAANDPGSLVNVAGVGQLKTAKNPAAARAFIEYLLSEDAQRYFAQETFEYPLIDGVAADERLRPLAEIDSPDLDLSDLADLEGTLELLRDGGVL